MGDPAATEHALGERVKELTALHATTRLLAQDDLPLDLQLQRIADLLPPAMQYPEITTGAIRYGDAIHPTAGHRASAWELEAPFVTASGTTGVVVVAYHEARPELALGPFLDEEVSLLASIAQMVRAAIDLRNRHTALQELTERLGFALDAANMGVWEWDVASGRTHWSDSLASMTGVSRLEGRIGQHRDLIHPEDRDYVFERLGKAAVGSDDLRDLAFRFRRPDGGWRHMLTRARIAKSATTKITAALLDVSERRALEAGLRHAQKLEAVGQMATSVAHDFNNLLAVLVSSSSILHEEVPTDSPWRQLVEDLLTASQRASALTKQLLAFTRKAGSKPSAVEVGQLVAQLGPLLVRIAGKVAVELDLEPGAGSTWADPVQLEQVIMNLVVNARDAMAGSGTITIRVRPESDQVVLEVADQGPGIDDDLKDKIFEPFFTTKESGKGTGLGLTVVAGVVRQWQGRVEIESAPGAGATFRVLLPRLA